MSGNSILNRAKYLEINDEWYTPYNLVENEVQRYKNHFENKVVLCNCDDPFESSFSKFFLNNFHSFKLKKLICTSYKNSKIHKIVCYENRLDMDFGYAMIVDRLPKKDISKLSNDDLVSFIKENSMIMRLRGDGDFRSEECVEYLKESDIVVTNPPFSKFIDMFMLLEQYEKKYLLIGNQNALMYKEIFPYIKNNSVWVGHHFGDMAFKVPNDTPPRKTRFWIDEIGQKWRSIGNAMWLTNLSIDKKNLKLKLTNHYNQSKYKNMIILMQFM